MHAQAATATPSGGKYARRHRAMDSMGVCSAVGPAGETNNLHEQSLLRMRMCGASREDPSRRGLKFGTMPKVAVSQAPADYRVLPTGSVLP